jgi:MFS family permease
VIRQRLGIAALYVGGLLGPFGGGMTAAMLPELGTDYDVTLGAATSSITAYLVPFAALMLFSGSLGERYGRTRTVMAAYAVYAVAALATAIAPTYELFLAGRVVQGAANAFTTPLLLAALAGTVATGRLGRALGTFAAFQSLGQASSPLVGGLAAELDWRWAFVGVAVVAGLLAVVGLPAPASSVAVADRPGRLRALWHPDVGRLVAVAAVGWACLGGLSFLVAIRAEDDFGLSAAQRGLLLTAFGVAGLFGARQVGRAVDRFGARRCALAGAVAGGTLVALCALWSPVALLAVGWAACGAASQFILVSLNTLSLSAVPENRGGAVSLVQAFRFGGGAVAPVAFLPLYHWAPVAGFVVPGALLALVTVLALGTGSRRTAPDPAAAPAR